MSHKSIKTILNKYLKMSQIKKRPATFYYEVSMSKYITECFMHLKISSIDDLSKIEWLDIIHWFKTEKPNLKNSTINKILKFLSSVLIYEDIDNPLGKLERLKDDTQGYDVATYDTMKKVYSYIYNLDDEGNNLLYKLIISLLRDTGCRRNELLNLKFSNIQFDPNMIILDITKNGKKRVTSFSNTITKPLLEQAYNKHGHLSDYVLWNYIKEERCSVDTIDYCMDKIKRNAKIRKLSSHMIRKFFASDMYNKLDGDVLTVQKLLGHASPDQTKVYIKDSADFLLKQYRKVIK